MSFSRVTNSDDAALAELRAIANSLENTSPKTSLLTELINGTWDLQGWTSDRTQSVKVDLSHAAPLMPLRDRDLKALDGWFDLEEIAEIEADIAHNLSRLFPEPCWEDNPFDFLAEFL